MSSAAVSPRTGSTNPPTFAEPNSNWVQVSVEEHGQVLDCIPPGCEEWYTFDGNRVRVTATIHNATKHPITAPVRFRDLTVERDLTPATGGEKPAEAEYQFRVPEHVALIKSLFEIFIGPTAPATRSTNETPIAPLWIEWRPGHSSMFRW